MKKSTITGIMYATLVPIQVWTGYELGVENYFYAAILIAIMMTFEVYTVKLWILAQTEEVEKLNVFKASNVSNITN